MNDDETIQSCFYLISNACQCEHLPDELMEETIKDDILCIIQRLRQMDYDYAVLGPPHLRDAT